MARSRLTNESAQRLRAPRERALRKKIHDPAVTLRNEFGRFLADRDLLDDMAREAAQRDVASGNGKALHVLGVKRADPVPEEVDHLVERALARSKGLFTKLELDLEAALLSESIAAYETGAGGIIRTVGLSGSFNLRNPLILDALSVRANKLAGDVADTTFDAIKETIARRFFVDGEGVEEVSRALRNEFDFLSTIRSRAIARTETGIVTEMGAFEQYAEIGVEKKKWLSALVEQTRTGHRKANGQTVGLFEPFLVEDADGNPEEMLHPMDPDASPSNVVNCFPGDVRISTVTTTLAMTRRWFAGELVEIVTRNGKKLAGTANHPALTDRGWIALAQLEEGECLICGCLGENTICTDPDPQYRDAPFDQLYRLASAMGVGDRHLGSRLDFHGDGENGEVDVIWTHGQLRNGNHSTIGQPDRELIFAAADSVRSLHVRHGAASQVAVGTFHTTHGLMGGRRDSGTILGRRSSKTRQLTFRSSAWNDAVLEEDSTNRPSGHAMLLREPQLGSALAISRDEIIAIRRFPFRGHVFNLQSTNGWYLSNDIVVHNCLCATGPVIEGSLRGPWLGE
jgi:hypothetical protein